MYIEVEIKAPKDLRDEIYNLIYSHDLYEITEYSEDVVEEVKRDKSAWDFLDEKKLIPAEGITKLLVYPKDEKEANALKEDLKDKFQLKAEILKKDEEDWAENWKTYYKPIELGKNLLILPEWEKANTDRTVIKVDPGMAFGTGTHESTELSIINLEKYLKPSNKIADIGCGSGILAICALKLCASRADLVDIDPIAVKASKANLRLNAVEDRASVFEGSLLDVLKDKYDLIISNIIAEILVDEIKNLSNHLVGDKIFISSGIIREREDMVRAALLRENFVIIDRLEKNNWVSLVAKLDA